MLSLQANYSLIYDSFIYLLTIQQPFMIFKYRNTYTGYKEESLDYDVVDEIVHSSIGSSTFPVFSFSDGGQRNTKSESSRTALSR